MDKKLLLASPRGFCAGVKRAIEAVENTLAKHPGETIYCYHEIVHNTHVVKDFEKRGVKFTDDLGQIPNGSVLIFSSHGVSPQIKNQAQKMHLKTVDATCPFVAKTHLEVKNYAKLGFQVIYIGQPKHDEAVGTCGEAEGCTTIVQSLEDITSLNIPKNQRVALVTQTTLSFDESKNLISALKKKFPDLQTPPTSDICMATQNRQNGVKELVNGGAKIVIVLGSLNSSNSNRLRQVAEKMGAKAILADDISEINAGMFTGPVIVGLTAGASLPENKITEAIIWFKSQGFSVEDVVVSDESKISLASVPL